MIHNQKGFVGVFLIAFLPLIISLLLLFYHTLAMVKIEQNVLHQCRKLQIEDLNKTKEIINKILKLNPRALQLRFKYKMALVKLALAYASENPVAIAAAHKHLHSVQAQRELLETTQQSFFKAGQFILVQNQMRVLAQSQIEFLKTSNLINLYFDLKMIPQISPPQKIQLVPDLPETAPIYKTPDDYEKLQALVQKWIIAYSPKGFIGKYLSGVFQYQISCSTTLSPERDEWQIISHQKDKSLLRF